MKEDGTVNRAALPTIFNPEDLHALEAALEVKARFGGTVTAITMGPPKAGDVLRDCVFRGADRAILVTDRRAAGSDTLATSYILSQAVRAVGRYDMVFCGRQAIDGDTAQVGPQCAEKLGIPQVTYLEEVVSIEGSTARVRRNIGHGWELIETELPVLFTVVETANEPRPPATRRVMKMKRAVAPAEVESAVRAENPKGSDEERRVEVERRLAPLREKNLVFDQWGLDEIDGDPERCGLAGSPTKVFRIQAIVLKKEGYTEVPATDEGIRRLTSELVVDRTLG